MRLKKWTGLALAAPLLLVGCKGFWDPIGSDFTLSNSGAISVSTAGATGTSTITVTPSSSFSGAVALTCAVTTSPSSASSPVTCSLSPTTVTISGSTAETTTLTATTTSTTTTGSYVITITGTSGSASTTTTACVTVGTASGSCSSSSASTSGDFYVLNAATDQVAGYYVNAGTLTALFNPLTLPAAKPLSIAIAPNGAFLYISTAGGIFDYTISSGQLTLASTTPISQDQAISMQVSPDNNWLLEIQSGAPYIYAIAIDSSNGTLATANEKEVTVGLSKTTPEQVAISPDGSYVFVAMGSGTNASGAATAGGTAFVPFDASNSAAPFGGTITTINTISASGSALSVAVDPLQSGQTSPRLFYVGETLATSGSSNTGGLRVFEFSTLGSGVKEISGSPFAIAGLAPYSILPVSTGNYVYVVNRQTSSGSTGVIAGFSISASDSVYTLTALGSTFAAGTNSVALAEDNTGTFVFAVDYGGNPDLEGYTFSSSNAGYLTSAISGATGTDPVQASAVAAAP